MRPDLWQFCMVAETAMRTRYDLSQPFSRGQYSYATNGHILVRLPRICEDAEAHWPNVEALTAGMKFDSLSPLPQLAVPDPETCPVCKGYGLVRPCSCIEGCKRCDWGWVAARKPHEHQENCHKCEGRKVVWPERCHVYLTPRLAIDPRYYKMLAALPNVRVDLTIDGVDEHWRQSTIRDAITFTFDGGDGQLMPLRLRSPMVAEPVAA